MLFLRNIMLRKLSAICYARCLGDPPSHYCTNDSEAINSAVKQHLQFKKSNWPTFNEKMKKFVADQQEEVCKAILGTGQYVLKEKYTYLAVSPHHWFTSFTTEQLEENFRKLHLLYVKKVCCHTSNVKGRDITLYLPQFSPALYMCT